METRSVSAESPQADAILATAADLFFERGFSPVTTAELSAAAGVSKKTLYRLFPTKEALLLAVVRREMGALGRRLDEIAGSPGAGPVAIMRDTLGVIARQIARVGRVMLSDVRRVPGLWEEIDRIRREVVFGRLERLLSRAVSEGVVRPDIDLRLLRELHVVLIQNLVTPEQLFRLDVSPLALFESVIRIVYAGILTPRGRRVLARELGKGIS